MEADPHLEEVVRYLSLTRGAAVLGLAPPFGGFVAAVVLTPDRRLLMTAFYVGFSCAAGLLIFLLEWRKLVPRLRAAPPVPLDAVEVRRRSLGLKVIWALALEIALLLGGGWFWAAYDDSSFASGLLFPAVCLSAYAVGDLAVRWSVGRWERRNGRVLKSLLLGEGVFYVERGAHAA
jgi:hypothetical protein